MTPKEKAEELVDKYLPYNFSYDNEMNKTYDLGFAKQCALIAVDELLFLAQWADESIYKYWQEVKQEIEKL